MARLTAELKDLSTRLGDTIDETFSDGEDFEVKLTAEIGVRGSEGADIFYLTVLSPSRVQAMADRGPSLLRGRIVSNEFSKELIEGFLEAVCRRTSGRDWEEIARKLSLFFDWEFEGL